MEEIHHPKSAGRVSPLCRFQEPIKAMVLRGKGIDIRAYEVASVDQVAAELQPATLARLSEARTLLGSLIDSCETVEGPHLVADGGIDGARTCNLPFERAVDATVASKLGSQQAVEEIAFIAQLELRQRAERLEHVKPAQGVATLLGECDSSLRRIRKALSAVDVTIARIASVPPLLDFSSELETSLVVRRGYAKFRARVIADGDPQPETLRARFRAVGTQIAILVGWDVYTEMRVRDRLLLRELQQRFLSWLRGGVDATPAAGLRLWQDFASCVEMLSLVNRRQELVEHDVALVRETIRTLTELDHDSVVTPRLWQRLSALDGLDAELDEILTRPPPTSGQLASVLVRLSSQLGPPTSPPPSEGVPW